MINSSVYGGNLQEYVVRKIREMNQERNCRIAALKTREDAENYVREVRRNIASCFRLPEDRSVPRSESLGFVQYDSFKIEKVIYFSRKDLAVTANLYLPDTPGKHPAVLFLCGHSQIGKAGAAYVAGAANLARKGFVVLVVDPISQGERLQFVGAADAKDCSSCTREHNMLGKKLRLFGDFFGAWRAYDALRGLDYLLSRSEIDPARVGITGNSGGGTMTSFVQALDERFTMAAPSCYITSWQRNFENELPADVEQMIPGLLAKGCEMGDLLLAHAPRPILVMGQKNDFFDPRGLVETCEQVKKVYALLGAEDNIQYFIGPTEHSYSVENREAMYGFFGKHAALTVSDKEDFDAAAINADALNCTASGQLAVSRPELPLVQDFISTTAKELAASRQILDRSALKARLQELLALPDQIDEPYCRILRGTGAEFVPDSRKFFCRFALEGEPGLLNILQLNTSWPYKHFPAYEKVTLYIPHLDSRSELLSAVREDDEVWAGLDMRGVGEVLPLTTDPYPDMRKYSAPYSQNYHYDSIALMFGSSMVGWRVLDILRAVKFIKARGVKCIEIVGRGLGSIPAAMAALLCDDIAAVKLYDALENYTSLAERRVTRWPQSCMVPGILEYMDLPDIYAALRSEKPFEASFVSEPIPE